MSDFLLLMARTENLTLYGFRDAVVVQNCLARTSDSARRKLYKELKGRYLLDNRHELFSAFLTEWNIHSDSMDRQFLAYVLFNLHDRGVFVTSIQWLYPHLRQPASELRVGDLIVFLQSLGRTSHPEIAAWSPTTLIRVAQHYLASIRDFGLATGGTSKNAVRPSLRAAPVRLLLHGLRLAGVPTAEILRHEAFRMLGVAQGEVLDILSELNRHGNLRFRIQADVIELSL